MVYRLFLVILLVHTAKLGMIQKTYCQQTQICRRVFSTLARFFISW